MTWICGWTECCVALPDVLEGYDSELLRVPFFAAHNCSYLRVVGMPGGLIVALAEAGPSTP